MRSPASHRLRLALCIVVPALLSIPAQAANPGSNPFKLAPPEPGVPENQNLPPEVMPAEQAMTEPASTNPLVAMLNSLQEEPENMRSVGEINGTLVYYSTDRNRYIYITPSADSEEVAP